MTAPRSDSVMELVQTGEIDIVCCELHSDPAPGVELARILSQERPNVPIILLGELGDEPELAAALSTTVAGLFTKSAGLDEFLAGVRAVLSGHRAIGSGVIGELLQHLNSPTPMDVRRFGNHLSPTELEILAMIGQAQSIPSIAASRGISHKTVRNHLAKIYRKLDLHGRTEAMLWAARMGLTSS
jgi:DNA-binding NarL/FixJ family response regulator